MAKLKVTPLGLLLVTLNVLFWWNTVFSYWYHPLVLLFSVAVFAMEQYVIIRLHASIKYVWIIETGIIAACILLLLRAIA